MPPTTTIITDVPASAMGAEMALQDWIRVLQFGDSTLPTGAFSFSHGLESAIEQQWVRNADDLRAFVKTAVGQAARGDAVALLVAHQAAMAGDVDTMLIADQYVFNRKLNEETRAMTVRTGKKLIELAERVVGASMNAPLLKDWRARVAAGQTPGCHPICLASLFAALHLPQQSAFLAHQYGVAMAILGAALRMMKVDHVDTQTILFEINADIARAYAESSGKTLEDMAGFAPMIDVLAAVHVKAHVRLFMN